MNIDLNRVVYNCDYPHSINGVPGRFKSLTRKPGQIETTWFKQEWRSHGRKVSGWGAGGEMFVNISFDDCCGNGKNSFAITANIYTNESRRRNDSQAGGCLHDEIAEVFPELAPLIKWHLVDTNGPMHYVANTVYHASNLHNGFAKGEPCAWDTVVKFGDFPISFNLSGKFRNWLVGELAPFGALMRFADGRDFNIVAISHADDNGYKFRDKFTFEGHTSVWHECPFDSQREAEDFKAALALGLRIEKVVTQFSEGKERDFKAARNSANWPEATDEQLSLPAAELENLLLERLPPMLAEFKRVISDIGLWWSPAEYVEVENV